MIPSKKDRLPRLHCTVPSLVFLNRVLARSFVNGSHYFPVKLVLAATVLYMFVGKSMSVAGIGKGIVGSYGQCLNLPKLHSDICL